MFVLVTVLGPVAHPFQPLRRHRPPDALFARPHAGVRRTRPPGRLLSPVTACWRSSSTRISCRAVARARYQQLSGHAVEAGAGEPGAALRGMLTAMMVDGVRRGISPTAGWRSGRDRFLLRLVTSLAIMHGGYQTGTLYDMAWIAPFRLYAAAALAAPDSPKGPEPVSPTRQPATPPRRAAGVPRSSRRLRALFIQPLGGAGDSFRAMLTGLVTVAGLGVLTLRLATQGGELQRTAPGCGCWRPRRSRRGI